ncbi:MAG TPA: 2'-5' RNA ligase family protein [Trichocoleus sp.]|jgi:hypothetical protein
MKVSFWLIPAEEDREVLQEMIDHLAETHDAPFFAPHLTLYSGEYADDADLSDVIRSSAQGIRAVTLAIDGLQHTEEYQKSLFIQFRSSKILAQIATALQRQASKRSKFTLDFHLSLLYGSLSEAQKQDIITKLDLTKQQIVFNEIWAIAISDQVETTEDVESWKVLCSVKMR